MDTETIYKIIDIIDTRIQWTINDFKLLNDQDRIDNQQEVLNELKKHLQSYIDEPDEDICQCCGGHINMCDEECTQILNKTEE